MAGNSSHTVPGAAGSTIAIPRLGIPETILTDGPAGVRINPTTTRNQQNVLCNGLSCGLMYCCYVEHGTRLFKVGKAIGSEVKAYNCDVILVRDEHFTVILCAEETLNTTAKTLF